MTEISYLFLLDELMFQFPGHHLQLWEILKSVSLSSRARYSHVWRYQVTSTETESFQHSPLRPSLSYFLPAPCLAPPNSWSRVSSLSSTLSVLRSVSDTDLLTLLCLAVGILLFFLPSVLLWTSTSSAWAAGRRGEESRGGEQSLELVLLTWSLTWPGLVVLIVVLDQDGTGGTDNVRHWRQLSWL